MCEGLGQGAGPELGSGGMEVEGQIGLSRGNGPHWGKVPDWRWQENRGPD